MIRNVLSPWTVSLTIVLLLISLTHAATPYPLRPAVECRPRQGLPNVLVKLQQGSTVRIAYLGGSITAAPGWRVKSRVWFQEQYPQAKVQEIHAAIGGTGSDLGVFRLQQDVLRHHPDLLFVEFAVNDGGTAPQRIQQAMEGIVRQTWQADPEIDICFVYTLTEGMLKDLQGGTFQRSASAMEEIADHYGIPSIHMGLRVAEMERAGELIFKAPKTEGTPDNQPMVFSHDGVHPLVNTGHELYLQSIVRSMALIATKGAIGEHPMPPALRADNWEKAKLIPLTPDMLTGSWEALSATHPVAKRFQRNMPSIQATAHAGSAIRFSFRGTCAGVFDIMGPDGGAVQIQLDDPPIKSQRRMDGYCTYHRMNKFLVAQDLDDKDHTVTLTLSSEALNRRDILFERNRHDFDAHPEKYQDTRWYVGGILLIGELHAAMK